MGWPFGDLALAEKLSELDEALQNYFGSIAEVRLGLRTIIPDKPEALILTEQCKDLGLPLVQGGIEDQPYIWMKEYAICVQTKALFEAINKAQEKNKDG